MLVSEMGTVESLKMQSAVGMKGSLAYYITSVPASNVPA
jgi:hypothetical protein